MIFGARGRYFALALAVIVTASAPGCSVIRAIDARGGGRLNSSPEMLRPGECEYTVSSPAGRLTGRGTIAETEHAITEIQAAIAGKVISESRCLSGGRVYFTRQEAR